MANQYFENNENLQSEIKKISYFYKGVEINFFADNGVFSKSGIDFGSNLLLKTVDLRNTKTVLDVGCGYGTIGVTIAKTYGYLINKELIPVSSLKSLAISSNRNDVVMSVITANRSSYYVGIYDSEYNNLIDEEFVSREKLLELINKYKPYIVSNDFNVVGIYKLNKVSLDVLKIVNYYKDMNKVNYHALVPNYLKLPQAMENR